MYDDPLKYDNLSPQEQRRLLRREEENEALIFELTKNSDMDGFELALRNGRDASLRLKAARALGECYEISAVSILARSCIEEPDPGIREAAYASLKQLMEDRVDQVIASHRQDRHLDGPWIIGEADGTSQQPTLENNNPADKQDKPAGEMDIYSLFTRLQNSIDDLERENAVRALEQIPEQRGIKALMAIAEFGQFDIDRADAQYALQMIYGDRMETELQNYQEEVEIHDPQPESIATEELRTAQPETWEIGNGNNTLPSLPTILEERMNIIQYVLLGLLGSIVVLIIYLFTRLR